VASERVLDAATISQLLEAVSKRSAVVLERLPRGGGATNWFHCTTPHALRSVLDVLHPASKVSFYFDGRVADHQRDAHLYETAERLLAESGDIVLGTMPVDGCVITVDFPSSRREVDEQLGLASSTVSRLHRRIPRAG